MQYRATRNQIWFIVLSASLIFLLVLISPLLFIQNLRSEYVNELAIKRRHFIQPNLVMIGDSHIARGSIWGPKLKLDPFSVITVARAGATSSEVMGFAQEGIEYHPKAYVIEVGDNDIIRGPFDFGVYLHRYRNIISSLKKDGARVIVTLIPPPTDASWGRTANQVDNRLRAELPIEGAQIIDLRSAMADEQSAGRSATVDGTHLSDIMYGKWAAAIVRELHRSHQSSF